MAVQFMEIISTWNLIVWIKCLQHGLKTSALNNVYEQGILCDAVSVGVCQFQVALALLVMQLTNKFHFCDD